MARRVEVQASPQWRAWLLMSHLDGLDFWCHAACADAHNTAALGTDHKLIDPGCGWAQKALH